MMGWQVRALRASVGITEEVTVASDRTTRTAFHGAISRRASARRRQASPSAANSFVLRPMRRLTRAAASSARTIASSSPASASAARATRSSAASRGCKNVEIKTLCDIDANLAPARINDARLKDVATFKPGFVQDLRRVLDDKDIDAVVIATPNHWHALATIWALQAGKHVYVEKPSSHTVWEGRKMVEAAARYNKIVQVGTMNRSRPAVRAGDQVHPRRRHRQGLHGARPLLQAAAVDRQVPGRADGAGREVRADRRRRRTTSRPTTRSTSRRSTTTCGSDRRRSGRSIAIASTTTGTGTGTTATATPATRDRTSSTSRAGG